MSLPLRKSVKKKIKLFPTKSHKVSKKNVSEKLTKKKKKHTSELFLFRIIE